MRSRWSRVASLCVAGALVPTAAACSSTEAGGDDDGTVTITVTDMPPATQEKQRNQFNEQVAEFERANPGVDVKPTEAKWDAKTFTARIAGNQLETAFIVPLTEPQGLIKRGQIADITDQVKSLPNADKFDERALAPGTAGDRIHGLPTSEFTLSLVYNRELFTKAGLDPDNPPGTWQDVRAAAKAISAKTGVPGYVQPTTSNTGGWTLTAMSYTYGGRAEKEEGGKHVVALDEPPMRDALKWLKELRWRDKSMGSQHLWDSAEIHKAFAAGRVGMMMATPSVFEEHVTKFNGDPKVFGVTTLPRATESATMLGGKMAVFNPKATDEELAAAVKWIDFYYLRPKYDPKVAEERAEAKAADGLPVGWPTIPFYQGAVSEPVVAAVNKHANTPLENFKPYLSGIGDQKFVTDPPVAAQDLYAALDTAVAAILTRESADPAEELAKAEKKVTAALDRAQR